jgi:hypothetical protein
MMSDQNLELVTVAELRIQDNSPREFFIPSYQRGYRWTPTQVVQLLEDIREFARRANPQLEDFYCLQPLVIKARPDGKLEVVDGQQRLTTLFLVLRHFNERLAARFQQTSFELVYETRPGLASFLASPSKDAATANADFHHFFEAIEAIEAWFSDRETEVEELKTALLNRTKVIWYQLAEADNPVDAFTRLNVGKIPLTNDELIRALFLRRQDRNNPRVSERQLRIAQEWDQLEKALQSDAFWYFLNNERGPASSRIGLLFEIVAAEDDADDLDPSDAYALFYHFNQRLAGANAEPAAEWMRIRRAFLALEEWFNDRVLFHLVGFLVNDGMRITELRELARDCTKSAFERRLRKEIFRRTVRPSTAESTDDDSVSAAIESRLAKLAYGSHRGDIRRILLLFNLATLLSDGRSNIRFQFESFKQQRWDIEHIRSVSDDRPDRHDDRKVWLGHCLTYLESDKGVEELCGDIRTFLALPRNEAGNEVFDPLYVRVLSQFDEADESESQHGLGNLTLLDQTTNRSYGNSVFAVKRRTILDLDQAGIFVPLCTRNVFLKCYSAEVGHALRWTEVDQEGYLDTIRRVLSSFFDASLQVAA